MSYPTVSRAIEGYLLFQAASGRSSNTLRNYRTELFRFSDWIKGIPIDQVNSKELETYMIFLRNDFRITHVATTPIKPRKIFQKTLSNAHGALAVFWKWSSKEFNIPNRFTVSPIKSYTKPIYPLKEEEIEKLLNACRQSWS